MSSFTNRNYTHFRIYMWQRVSICELESYIVWNEHNTVFCIWMNCAPLTRSYSSRYRGRRPWHARVFGRRSTSLLVLALWRQTQIFTSHAWNSCYWRSWRGIADGRPQTWRRAFDSSASWPLLWMSWLHWRRGGMSVSRPAASHFYCIQHSVFISHFGSDI